MFRGCPWWVCAAGLDTHHDSRDELADGVFTAVRAVQMHLGARPRSLAPIIRSRSLTDLCRIVDARATGGEELGTAYLGVRHAVAGEGLLRLDQDDLVMGSVQVIDALVQQVAPGSSPVNHPDRADTRQILVTAALPSLSMEGDRRRAAGKGAANASPASANP